jgi:hypothetical protein
MEGRPMQSTLSRLALDSMAEYEIRIQGYLSENWSDRMGGVSIQVQSQPNETAVTVLTGAFQDQAALAGVLNTLYDLGFPLLSVECLRIQPTNRRGLS